MNKDLGGELEAKANAPKNDLSANALIIAHPK